MINKRDIKSLLIQAENINGVFDYVMEMVTIDQIKQAHSLIEKMSQRQMNWFEQYLEDCPYDITYIEEAKELIKIAKH